MMLMLISMGNLQAAEVLPKATAEKFGELNILYNDRICPVQTYALDFCKKIYGARSYKGLTEGKKGEALDARIMDALLELKNDQMREVALKQIQALALLG